MEFKKLQFNARKAFFMIASDITIIVKDNGNNTYDLDMVGGGKCTIPSNYMQHNVNLSDSEIEALANSIENSLKYKEDTK